MIPQRHDRREPPDAPSAALERPTLDLSESDGTVVVRVADGTLATAEDISAFEAEVGHLLDAGYERIALDFSAVSRLSRDGVNGLIRVQQRFRQAGVGLKLRAVQPHVAAGLGLAGANPPSVEIPAAAPHDNGGRTAPTNGQAKPVVRYPEPRTGAFVQHRFDFVASGAMYVDPTTVHEFDIAEILGSLPKSAPPARAAAPVPAPAGDTAARLSHVWLRVRSGRAAGQTIEVRGPKFTIGRDSSCQLRARSTFVSRVHASIAQRGGRVFVRDEVSSNGTTVNGRLLRDEEIEVVDGAQLDIGPMQFTIAIVREPSGPAVEGPLAVDEAPAPAQPAPAAADADFWSGVQFTCAVQPGSLVRLNAPPAVRTEAAPVAAASGAVAWPSAPPVGGRAALEHLLHQLLRVLGSGEPAAEAPVPAASPPSPPRARGRAAARRPVPTPPAEPAPPAEPVTDHPPRYAVTMERGEPSAADLPLYVRDAGTGAFDDEEPAAPSAAVSGVGLDIERLLEEAAADASDPTPTARYEPRLDTALTGQRALELQFDCPNCGEPGQVPISRMGGLFRCNTCQTDFRIDPSGTRALHQDLPPRTPIWKRCAAAAAVLVLLLVGHAVANSALFFGSPGALTSYTLKALIQDKPDRVMAIAAGGTTRTTRRWVRLITPILKGLNEHGASAEIEVVSSGDVFAETTISFQLDPSAGSAPKAVDADAGKAGPRPPPNAENVEKGVIRVTIRWVRSRGTWYLDGRSTLRGSSKLVKQYAQVAAQAR